MKHHDNDCMLISDQYITEYTMTTTTTLKKNVNKKERVLHDTQTHTSDTQQKKKNPMIV
jgi:hypothetical protein